MRRKSWVCREAFDPELGREYLDRCASSQFKDFNANQFVVVPNGDDLKKVNKARAWLTHPARRSFQAISFLPGKAAPAGHYNLWRGFAVSARAGDWSLLRAHIVDVICGGDHASAEYLLDWMAFGVQHPDRPAEVAIVMQGSRGTGKGKLASMYGKLFGQHALQITQIRHLTGNFNAHLRSCVFLFADEALWAGDKAAESVLKGLITERTLQIEGKGANNVTAPNRLHIMMASNNDWVVPAGPGERRFFVLRVGDQHAQDHAYFAAIDKQMLELGGLSAMMYELMRRDLTKVDIRKMPRTAGLDEQVLLSLEPAPLWWIDHLGKTYAPADWKFQSRSSLRFGYSAALGANSHGKSAETRFGMFLKSVLPGGALKKVQHAMHGAALEDCYELPDQAACKTHLMQKLGLQNDPWV